MGWRVRAGGSECPGTYLPIPQGEYERVGICVYRSIGLLVYATLCHPLTPHQVMCAASASPVLCARVTTSITHVYIRMRLSVWAARSAHQSLNTINVYGVCGVHAVCVCMAHEVCDSCLLNTHHLVNQSHLLHTFCLLNKIQLPPPHAAMPRSGEAMLIQVRNNSPPRFYI